MLKDNRPIEDALRREISQLQADNISLVEQMNQIRVDNISLVDMILQMNQKPNKEVSLEEVVEILVSLWSEK